MRLIVVTLSVVSVHLALLGWVQVQDHLAPPDSAVLSVQTRQIVEPRVAAAPPSPAVRHSPKQVPRPLAPAAHVAAPKAAVPPVQTVQAPAPVEQVPTPAGMFKEPGNPIGPENLTTSSPPSTTQVTPTRPAPATSTQLPSSSAEYLKNPAPVYPALSLRLNESGKVVVRVLIGKNGRALDGSVVQSSGYDRLDQSALRAVLNWRFVPGKVDGQPQDMWFDVPIQFKPTY